MVFKGDDGGAYRANTLKQPVAGQEPSPSAEAVAAQLAYEFLRMGQYAAASGPIDIMPFGAGAAGADVDDQPVRNFAAAAAEFSGLAVQSVGFEEGPKEPKVHVYLTRGSVRQMKALPLEIQGVPIKTHRMGAITVRPDAAASATNRGNIFERNDRVCCGSSCAPTSERTAGTLGALVTVKGANGIYLLSNNHVLSGCNHVPQNQPILAPASTDGRPDIRAPREVGRHQMLHELRSGDPYFVNPCDADLALARVNDKAVVSSWQGDATEGYDTPDRAEEPVSLQRVKKFGRTTGLTFGEVEAKVSTPMPVTYTAKHFKGVVWFRNVWTIRAAGSQHFALPGDSGSLVVSEDASTALGLVFAANPSGEYAWIIPMPCAMAAFGGLSLVSSHGV